LYLGCFLFVVLVIGQPFGSWMSHGDQVVVVVIGPPFTFITLVLVQVLRNSTYLLVYILKCKLEFKMAINGLDLVHLRTVFKVRFWQSSIVIR
jgi:hypothetical protein